MKKKLLLGILSLFAIGVSAQITPCATCYQGAHRGLVVQDSLHHSRMVTGHPLVGNGNNGLGTAPTYVNQNVCGLNYFTVSQEITTRATWQPGPGFPATFPIANCLGTTIKAFLYWGISYWGAVPTYTASITDPNSLNTTYPATMIGTGPAKCWGETGTAAYRADITAAMTVGGPYSINLTGQSVSSEDKDIDGMTLVYIYSEPATFSGSIALWDGDNAWYGIGPDLSETFTGINVCAASASASAFVACGDMQNNVAPTHVETLNGSSGTFPNSFWNTDIVPTTVTAAQTTTTYSVDVGNAGDCYSWILAGLYWQNTTCMTCIIPGVLNITLTSGNPTCGNINGFITANVTGGSPPYTYRWSNGQTTMTISNLSAGTYSITVKDNTGCDSIKDSITLVTTTVRVTPTYTNIRCNGQCNGSIHISASGGVPPFTFTWNPGVGIDSNATNLCAGSYTVTVQDNNGCTTIDTLTITQPPALTATLTSVGALCNGGSTGSSVATAGGGTPPYTYAWTNGSTTNTASSLSAGTFTLTLTDANGCSISPTVTISQPAAILVNVTGPQIICANTNGTLTANVTGGTLPYTYTWNTGATTSQITVTPAVSVTDTVHVTDANGCQVSGTFTIILGPPFSVITSGPASMCSGRSATLCATAIGGTGGNTFVWQPGNINGACIVVAPTSTTTYTITATDNCGTSASTTILLSINPLPAISFAADVYQGCAPLCVQFRNSTTVSGGILGYVWSFGNGDSSHSAAPIYCYPNNGSYSVELTAVSDSGCSATLNVLDMITVYNHPYAAFIYSPNPVSVTDPLVQFTDQTSGPSAIAYYWWTFGEAGDTVSNLQNPTHVYQDTGTYCAQEVVMDIHGCVDTVTNCLAIEPVFTLYIPSAFTPNGNGRNDVFMPVGQYVKSFEMYIFDRWGTQLYHTTDIQKGWDGTVGGGSVISQEDTYVYKIFVTDAHNKQHSYIGNVTIIK